MSDINLLDQVTVEGRDGVYAVVDMVTAVGHGVEVLWVSELGPLKSGIRGGLSSTTENKEWWEDKCRMRRCVRRWVVEAQGSLRYRVHPDQVTQVES